MCVCVCVRVCLLYLVSNILIPNKRDLRQQTICFTSDTFY